MTLLRKAARVGRAGASGGSLGKLREAGLPGQHELGGTDQDEGPPGREFVNLTTFDVPLHWDQIAFGTPADRERFRAYEWPIPGATVAKGLGGCGIHNGMLYLRGAEPDFGAWPAGWQWEDVLPFYIGSENNTDATLAGPLHGSGGPMQVGLATCGARPLRDAIASAFRASGHPENADFNGASGRTGFGVHQFNIRDGIRDSAAVAYLRLVRGRSNLEIQTGAEVTGGEDAVPFGDF